MGVRLPGDDAGRYRAAVALVVVPTAPTGAIVYCYRGDRLPGNADPDRVAFLLANGFITKIGD